MTTNEGKGMTPGNILLLMCISLLIGAGVYALSSTIIYILIIVFILFTGYIILENNPNVAAYFRGTRLSNDEKHQRKLDKIRKKGEIRAVKQLNNKPVSTRAEKKLRRRIANEEEQEKLEAAKAAELHKLNNKRDTTLQKQTVDSVHNERDKFESGSPGPTYAPVRSEDDLDLEKINDEEIEKYRIIHGEDYPTSWDGMVKLKSSITIPMPIARDGKSFCSVLDMLTEEVAMSMHPNDFSNLQKFMESQREADREYIVEQLEAIRRNRREEMKNGD